VASPGQFRAAPPNAARLLTGSGPERRLNAGRVDAGHPTGWAATRAQVRVLQPRRKGWPPDSAVDVHAHGPRAAR
jgi:hypothetical protein